MNCDLKPNDVVYTVDKIDDKYMLCKGTVNDLNFHATSTAHVLWTDPPRAPSYRHTLALSKSPVVAIVSRRDLSPAVLQKVEQDAKNRGLLAAE